MIYIYSNSEIVNDYFKKNFSNYGIKNLQREFFKIKPDFKSEDIFILDTDDFEEFEDIFSFYDNLPKNLKVVAFATDLKLRDGAYFIKKGFKSYLGKKTAKIIIEQALKTVKEGNIWLYPELMNFIIQNLALSSDEEKTEQNLEVLSSKEKKVAKLVAKGYSNKQIGNELDIQLVTVKKHISKIFEKLDIKDRVALAIFLNSK